MLQLSTDSFHLLDTDAWASCEIPDREAAGSCGQPDGQAQSEHLAAAAARDAIVALFGYDVGPADGTAFG